MKKRFFLHISLLVTSLSMAGCATSRNTDGSVDACKLTKPPKESYVIELPHGMGRSFTYPDLSKGVGNYTGCLKTWLNDSILTSLKLDNGAVIYAEITEPDKESVVCEFNKNGTLVKGNSSICSEYAKLPTNQ